MFWTPITGLLRKTESSSISIKMFVINLMSSPGAGKTSLVEQTIVALRDRYGIAVIEGDVQDTCDADRIAKLDIPVCSDQHRRRLSHRR